MKPNRVIYCALALLLALALLIISTGCSALGKLFSGGSADEIFSAAEADVFGADEPEYTQITVILPIHAGYSAIADNSAYASLSTDNQRLAYERIQESIFRVTQVSGEANGAYQLSRALLPSLSSAEIFMVKEAVLTDHPEAFWVTGNYTLSYNLHDGDSIMLYSSYTYLEIVEMLEAIEQQMAAVLKEIPSNRTEYERELIIHDCLVRDINYDSEAAELAESYTISSTVYGALVNKTALCSGYAQAAKLLLNRVGVSCATVKGVSKGVGHMWNIVCIDGQWYHLDITWDDPITLSSDGITKYDYFNLTDTGVSADHIISGGYETLDVEAILADGGDGLNFYNFPLPACTATAANFYEKNCTRIETLNDDGVDVIAAQMSGMSTTGETAMYLWLPDVADSDFVVAWLDKALGKGMSRSNKAAGDNGGRRIAKCIRVVRADGGVNMWSSVYCVKLVFE